jgi:hypothetical protein
MRCDGIAAKLTMSPENLGVLRDSCQSRFGFLGEHEKANTLDLEPPIARLRHVARPMCLLSAT